MDTMPDQMHVKVDNWGVFFLQRLKHFFNRTDYCDLTLQFQDNAQLKVHRLVLSACTEYFELLERTCEMYEDCLVMPDDLQADIVVPIVNFMYTGQLEFRMDLLEKLHATSEIMNMPVLSKLLDSHRPRNRLGLNYGRRQSKPHSVVSIKIPSVEIVSAAPSAPKRSFAKAFEKNVQNIVKLDKKHIHALNKGATSVTNGGVVYRPSSPIPLEVAKPQKFVPVEPRPTRYELPEELDTDNIFENSFCNISYTSQPLMVHPETTKQYAKRPRQDKGHASTSKKSRSAILNIVECKKIEKEREESFYEESESVMTSDETEMFKPAYLNTVNVKTEPAKDPNQLFDQLLDQNDESAKVTIETTKNNKAGANLDHAKIISEVLKKYPHLVKSNKNIKLKIFNNPTTSKGTSKRQKTSPQPALDKGQNVKTESLSDFTYETDVLDSKQAARLIALGAENIEGPWICLICGTPGKALHFTSYFKFRRHLVEVHNEKPVLNICEYCGQRMCKRNHLLHHMYTKHGVEPPPSYNFPKCSYCNYIALTEALLVKHKLSHTENKNFRCNVCPSSFTSSNLLLAHIQNTGHKYIADRKHSHQCIYCLRIFVRENNLYAHLKTHHKTDAVKDGIIDESDDEAKDDPVKMLVKHEPTPNDYEDSHMEYHIQQKADGNIQLIQKRHKAEATTPPSKQKILNTGLTFEVPKAPKSKPKLVQNIQIEQNQDESMSTFSETNEEIVVIDNNEYIMSGNRLICRNPTQEPAEEYILSDMIGEKPAESSHSLTPTTSIDYTSILNSNENMQQASIILKDTGNMSESIPIYVSNEEEYKALISSNHNIIFDSDDSNKTLTVLTTPDAATLDDTRINLDNSQNNDMMLIHEAAYPLSVTEAVVTDNSNIVVVYSQQVSDPNKEYQLLTSQALGPQYAQSSAILTQNYDTVSTSSPVMSAHILDSQVAEWQGDIQQNIDSQHAEVSAVLQSTVHTEEVQSTSAPESIEDLSNNNPQVQPTTKPDNLNQSGNINNELEPELIQSSENVPMEIDAPIIMENLENAPVESINEKVVEDTEVLKQSDSQHIEELPILEDTMVEPEVISMAVLENTVVEQQPEVISMAVLENTVVEQQPEVISIAILENTVVEQQPEVISMAILENTAVEQQPEVISMAIPENTVVEQQPEVISMAIPENTVVEQHPEVISMDVQSADNSENIVGSDMQNSDTNENICIEIQSVSESNIKETMEMNIQEPITEIVNVNAIPTQPIICSENESCATVAIEQIQTLTSEWQENNVEAPLQDSTEKTEEQSDHTEVDKSIENIEEELIVSTNIPEHQIYASEISVSTVEENKSETSKVIEPRVKISSLLHDWDDNDESQEDNEVEKLSSEPIEEMETSDSQNPDFHSLEVIPDRQELVSDNASSETVDNGSLSVVPDDGVFENTPLTNPDTNVLPENEILIKQNNIKSLVSDWDDDEEDNKE